MIARLTLLCAGWLAMGGAMGCWQCVAWAMAMAGAATHAHEGASARAAAGPSPPTPHGCPMRGDSLCAACLRHVTMRLALAPGGRWNTFVNVLLQTRPSRPSCHCCSDLPGKVEVAYASSEDSGCGAAVEAQLSGGSPRLSDINHQHQQYPHQRRQQRWHGRCAPHGGRQRA